MLGGDSLRPIRFVNILDVSQVNVILGWIVQHVYRGERAANQNQRARFMVDSEGSVRARWGVSDSDCSYTLYQAGYAPQSGQGIPTTHYLSQILHQLKKPEWARSKSFQ